MVDTLEGAPFLTGGFPSSAFLIHRKRKPSKATGLIALEGYAVLHYSKRFMEELTLNPVPVQT
jgi:hypothetical protein